jgi:NADH:ubiquinone oxidoreductase subunit H
VQWQAANATWGAALQPIGLAVVMVCMLAELSWCPSTYGGGDEIVAGWRTEFTGRRLALFRMGRDSR